MTTSTVLSPASGPAAALRRLLAYLGVLALALTGVTVAAAGPAHAASNVQVYVGYADTLRANPVNFPTPWSGAPNTTFLGCTVNCSFDAGAVRVVNNSPVSLTVDSVKVKLDTCVFDMWQHGVSLAPGAQMIITQTASGAAGGCNNANGFFDTSDIGPGNTTQSGCTPDGLIPEVDVSINGSVSAFQDSGQVLNTGGVDKAACPAGSNESSPWTAIGKVSCPGNTLTLAPSTQTVKPGSLATIQGTFANTCGDPLANTTVNFAVSGGPGAGTTGTAVTNSAGVATFQYSAAHTGTDTVGATVTNPAGTITSNNVQVVWQKGKPTLTITSAGSGDYNDPATVSATLADGTPIAGGTITFVLNGTETCAAKTNASGVATCTITPGEAAGPYTLTAGWSGSVGESSVSTSQTFTVTAEETTLAYTGDTTTGNGQTATLSGVLLEDGTTPIAGRTVAFTLGSGASAQTCSGTTDASGAASCDVVVSQPSSTSTAPVTAVFAGDAYYQPASAAGTVKFTYLTGRAYGLSSSGLVGISPTPDTGSIQTASAGTFAPPCVATISGLISAHTLCGSVVTSTAPGKSVANAGVQDATIGVLGLPVIKIGAVQSTSTSTCSAATGDTVITSVTVGGIPVNVNLHPGANTTVTVLGVTLIFNEQVPVAGASQGLTVNAVHVKALGLLDVVLASSTSDIHNC